MKTACRNLPKQILFFLTLILVITPACKKNQKHRNLTNANIAITAGSLEIAAGLSSFGTFIPTASFAVAPFIFLTLIPGLFITGGIYTLIWGIQVKKEIEQETAQCTPIDQFSLERIES